MHLTTKHFVLLAVLAYMALPMSAAWLIRNIPRNTRWGDLPPRGWVALVISVLSVPPVAYHWYVPLVQCVYDLVFSGEGP